MIRPATQSDVNEMLPPEQTQNGQNSQQQTTNAESFGFHAPLADYRPRILPSNLNAQPINNLRLLPITKQENTTVRGIVILTSPALFVQDSTGGLLVKESVPEPVRVGDEVEARGLCALAISARLWRTLLCGRYGGTPMPAISVTASQASTGAFDATFIEVEGRLRHKEHGPDDALIFDFDSGPQAFRAIMKRGRGDYLYSRSKLGSLLRIRGVSVVDPAYTQNITAFALLVRSTDDMVELAGPPWWTASHLVTIAIGFLLLALLTNFLYHRVENGRLRAVVEEREPLAFEMHDTLAQGFAGIGFQLEAIRTGVPKELAECISKSIWRVNSFIIVMRRRGALSACCAPNSLNLKAS